MATQKIRLTTLLFFFLFTGSVYAQYDYTCPNNSSNAFNDSEDSIESLLTLNEFSSSRIARGINHLNFNNLNVLNTNSNGYVCNKLNTFKSQWLTPDHNIEYTYYSVSNYYFMVSWYNSKTTGYKSIFVFNSQFQLVGVWPI